MAGHRATIWVGDPGAASDMSRMLRALALCSLVSLALVGCKVDVDLSGTQFSCSDGVTCPAGSDCVEGLCVARGSGGGDAGSGGSEPDAGETDDPDAQPLSVCDQVFGDAPEYELCAEEDASCRFAASTGGGTCREMCDRFGAECLEAFDNDQVPCEPQNAEPPDTCDTPRSTEICVCAIP